MTAIDPALAAAAREEVALLERKYPALVASGKLTADEATITYQAWHAIAHLIETGTFKAIDAGGVDGLTVVDWLLAEQAAERTVGVVERALGLARADPAASDDKVARLANRLGQLRAIVRIVSRRRADVDAINREFQKRRQAQAGA